MYNKNWPRWENLTESQKKRVSNGIGAEWMPAFVRDTVTKLSSSFFDEASWSHHDYGYMKGENERDRRRCDVLFYDAMKRDISRNDDILKIPTLLLATFFFVAVRLAGWGAFQYGEQEIPNFLKEYEL